MLLIINTELELISEWLKSNKLNLNISKTFYMVFHRGRRKFFGDIELFSDNTKINETNTMKYLGVIIDAKLNWISHTTYVKNKIANGIGVIRNARPLLNKSALTNLYHTFIYPYLIYCVEVWGSAKYVHLSPILLLQKKIIRLITFSERLAHTEPLFLQLNILPIDKLIQDRIGLFMYKMYNGLHPPTINNMYIMNSDVHKHNTRHKNYLHISMAHSDLYAKKRFYCSSILIWNEIMNKIEVSISFPQFEIVLKQYLLVNNLTGWVFGLVSGWLGGWLGGWVGIVCGWVGGWVGGCVGGWDVVYVRCVCILMTLPRLMLILMFN